ncbi:MAG: hypothetical protein P8H13_03170 [Polaribacter sp.]|nr:hypothetical protein [Polaribacter sp.]MDG1810925.1 hypothetical protein [Polaribacter sp.]MDG1994034.1 hypothetical protein [Polaribacter sp.]
MKKTRLTIIAVLLILPFIKTNAQEKAFNKYAIGFTSGTRGLGGEIITNLSKTLNLRASYSGYRHTESGENIENDVTIGYDAEGSIEALSLVVDYHLFKNSFKLIGGIVNHKFEVNAYTAPTSPFKFSDTKTFLPEELGSITAQVSYPNKWMPYLGLGFGNSLSEGKKVKLNASLGVLFSGSPELEMQGSGLILPTINQVIDIQEGLDEFGFFPILNIGVTFLLFKE